MTDRPFTRRQVPISKVVREVKRRARKHGIGLRQCRPDSPRLRELGRYYTVNLESTFIEATHVNIYDAALDLGVLDVGDVIASESGISKND